MNEEQICVWHKILTDTAPKLFLSMAAVDVQYIYN